MADNIVKIKCPQCGAVLSVKNQDGLSGKNVTCPVCKYKGLFTTFRNYVPKQSYSGGDDATSYGFNPDATQFNGGENDIPGQLRVISTGKVFRLKEGRNVIGRQAHNTSADIQLPTGDSMRMSREHLVITLKKVPGKGLTAFVTLFKEKVNKTYVNDSELFFGDTLVLNDGDIITLPDMKVKYEIPDNEHTTF